MQKISSSLVDTQFSHDDKTTFIKQFIWGSKNSPLKRLFCPDVVAWQSKATALTLLCHHVPTPIALLFLSSSWLITKAKLCCQQKQSDALAVKAKQFENPRKYLTKASSMEKRVAAARGKLTAMRQATYNRSRPCISIIILAISILY